MVNVYGTVNGSRVIIASSTVCVGACGKMNNTNKDNVCEDFELNGDCFYNSKYNYEYCIEVLLKNDKIYQLYTDEKNRVIATVKQ